MYKYLTPCLNECITLKGGGRVIVAITLKVIRVVPTTQV